MFSYNYRISGLEFNIESPTELWEDDNSLKFRCEAPVSADINVNLFPAAKVNTPEGVFCGRNRERFVWRSGDRISRCCKDFTKAEMHIRSDYLLNEPSGLECFVREEYWLWATRSQFLWPGIALEHLLLHFNRLLLHASYIEHNGRAILFTAPSQTGKSTQAELWRQYRNAKIINGDKAIIELGREVFAHGAPFCGTSGICENVSIPVAAIVVLSQGTSNEVTLLKPSQIAAELSKNVFFDRFIVEEWQLAVQLLLDLASAVPVYSFCCTPDAKAVEALERKLFKEQP